MKVPSDLWEDSNMLQQKSCKIWAQRMYSQARPGMSVYSQFNQDGILKLIFDRIGMRNKVCVEFGFGYKGNDITTELMDTAKLNTRLLAKLGWRVEYFDALISAPDFNITKAVLTEE